MSGVGAEDKPQVDTAGDLNIGYIETLVAINAIILLLLELSDEKVFAPLLKLAHTSPLSWVFISLTTVSQLLFYALMTPSLLISIFSLVSAIIAFTAQKLGCLPIPIIKTKNIDIVKVSRYSYTAFLWGGLLLYMVIGIFTIWFVIMILATKLVATISQLLVS